MLKYIKCIKYIKLILLIIHSCDNTLIISCLSSCPLLVSVFWCYILMSSHFICCFRVLYIVSVQKHGLLLHVINPISYWYTVRRITGWYSQYTTLPTNTLHSWENIEGCTKHVITRFLFKQHEFMQSSFQIIQILDTVGLETHSECRINHI